ARHGETYWNKGRRVQGGESDIELNELGLKQAARLAAFLKDEDIDAVMSSPLKRALASARAIAGQHKLPLEINDGLREIAVGELEGLSLSDLSSTFSQLLMEWWKGGTERLPGGESFAELGERSWKAVEPLLARHKEGTVVVISHYFVILAIIFRALDVPLEYLPKFKMDLGGMSVLEFAEYGTRLVTFNDTSYLQM
ncbi:MAG: histidine phosphatase family protein, partial [Chloroflexota bacterium]|nr:histidine phosphatase family protein [Chloroflexota bacterium]